jgi:PIN domain nuclease of toxin-antitoxin system
VSDRRVVFDASALLAMLNGERGADRVAAMLPSAMIGAVNLSEVVAKLAERGMPAHSIRAVLEALDLDVHPFDSDMAFAAGELRRTTRARGLSFGDRACLSLAGQLRTVAVTTDRAWSGVEIPQTTFEIIR